MLESKVILRELNNTVINVQTKEEMQELMKVFELAEIRMKGYEKSPLKNIDSWDYYGKDTCVTAYTVVRLSSRGYGIDPLENVKCFKDMNIISLGEYFERQGITQEELNKINEYFKE